MLSLLLMSFIIGQASSQDCTDYFIVAGGTSAANTGEFYDVNVSQHIKMWNQTGNSWVEAFIPLSGLDQTGRGSSPWIQFGTYLHQQTSQNVCLLGVAYQDSLISDWHPANHLTNNDTSDHVNQSQTYFQNLLEAIDIISTTSNKPFYIFWQHGEDNANYINYDPSYEDTLKAMVSATLNYNTNCQWIISETSYSPWNQNKYEKKIRQAQQNVIASLPHTYAGPNTDSLCWDYRSINYDFNEKGIKRVAYGWFQSYLNTTKEFSLGDSYCERRLYTLFEEVTAFVIFMSGILFVGTFVYVVFLCLVRRPNIIIYHTDINGDVVRKPLLNV